MSRTSYGRLYWAPDRGRESKKKKGLIVIFVWVSVNEAQLEDSIGLYSSLGWDSLVCRSDYLNIFFPERATSLAFSVVEELAKELRDVLCPVVFATIAGASKGCMYKVIQIVGGSSEMEMNMEDCRLVASCISGQIYQSDPIDIAADLGARFSLNNSFRIPGASKLLSLFARGVSSSLDALFLTRFGSEHAEYRKTLYSSVNLDTAFLVLHSQSEDVASRFAQHLNDVGGSVKVVTWDASARVGNYKHQNVQYMAAVTDLLEQAVFIFSQKIKKLSEGSYISNTHNEVSELICDLQNAAVDSNQSLTRVALGPYDHFFVPSSSTHTSKQGLGSLQTEQKDRSPSRSSPCLSPNTLLGEILFDACVPKNVEGWDIKFSGSLNGEPIASVRRRSPFGSIKHRSRL